MGLGGTDLNLLVALRALLEEANVTHAGRRLNLSQPAMSGALARLRRRFDDELLIRSGREYALTPLAFELLPAVQEAVRQANEALQIDDGFDPAASDRNFRIACSDYAMAIAYPVLSEKVRAAAPRVRLEFAELGDHALESNRAILDNDVLIGPLGYGFPGEAHLLFRDRLVCIVDRRNERLHNGALSMRDLEALPHAVATFGGANLTPADRVIGELGVPRRVQVTVSGWLALPFVVEGTGMVGVVPERLARRFARGTLVCVEPPFGEVGLVEGYWFRPGAQAERGAQWLHNILAETGMELEHDGPR